MPTKAMLEKENAALRRRITRLEKQLATGNQQSKNRLAKANDAFQTSDAAFYDSTRAEQALAEANAKLEKLIEVLPLGISVLNHEGRVVKQNPMLGTILNLSAEGLAHGEYRKRQYIHPDGTPFPVEEFPSVRILQGEAIVKDIEIGMVTEDEQRVWMQVSAAAVPFSDWKVVIVTRDISLQMQTEQDLRKSEERFSRVFHGNPAVQLISRVDNGRILDVNEACCRLVGCDRDELIGRNATELNFWADSAEQQQKIQQTRRSGVQGPFEVNVRHRSGEMHTIIVTSEPVEFKGLNALISTAIDITQHKKSEKALRESEQRFSTIFNYSPIAMVVSRLSDGRMIDANPAMQTLLGYSREEMIGHTAAELQAWDNLQERAALVEQLRSQKRVTNFETVARMKSGARVNVLVSAQVVVIDQEELLLGQIIDITQRKKDDEALRHSEAKYLALFQKSAVPAALTKMPEGIFVDVNEAFENAFGYSRQDILGRTSVEIGIIGVAERQKTYEEIERFGFVHKNEKHLITKSGAARDCLINVNPAKIQGEDYVITTIFDVTERNRAEEALRQAHEELELRVQQRTAELTQANAALQASKATLLGFYDSAPFMMGVAELDGDKTVAVSANRATSTFLAMQPKDLPGRTGIELGNPGDLEHLFVENYKRCQREGMPVRFEYNYPNSSGERWLNVSVSFIGIGVTGHPQFSFVVEDITEHKHAEIQKEAALEKLRENEARLRQVLDSTQDAIFAIDLEYRFLVNNRSHQQALIESGGHLFQVGELILSPDYPPEVVSHWRAAYDRALNGETFKMETNWPDASGQLHYSENNLAPLRDAVGAIRGVLVMVHDITERKRAEEALQQMNETLEQRVSERTYELAASEQKFRELADSITDVFFAFDRELRCTYWNKASELISGIPAEQAIGRTMLELFPDNPDVHQLMLLYQNVLITKQTQSMVNEYKIEGASHFYEIHAYPTVTGLSVFVRDATKIYQIQRDLEQSYAHMRDLSRQVIEAQENERRAIGRELHDEIGQTLTGLKILVEMVQRQSVETSREKLVQMQDVVGELIDHVNALSLDLRPPMLDDLGLLPALLWFIDRFTSRMNVTVAFQHDGLQNKRFTPAVETAVYRLVQEALTNIARHAKVETANVRILVREKYLELSVEDQGAGFDVQTAFERRDALGLNGMRERVRLLDGDLNVDSTPGVGTRIFIRLPLNEEGREA